MTNLKDVHLRLDEVAKAQWLEVVKLMGEKLQSQAFRRLVQQQFEEIKPNNNEDE